MNTNVLEKGKQYFYRAGNIFVTFLYMDGGKAIVQDDFAEDDFGNVYAVYPEQLEKTEQV